MRRRAGRSTATADPAVWSASPLPWHGALPARLLEDYPAGIDPSAPTPCLASRPERRGELGVGRVSDKMAESAAGPAGEHATSLRALYQALYDLWQFGGNALVGWMPTRVGVEVLTVPKIRLFNSKSLPRRVFAGDRLMGQQTFSEVSAALGVQSVELRLPLPVGDGPDALPVSTIEPVFSPFAVTKVDHRAVILFDIVGSARVAPGLQAR